MVFEIVSFALLKTEYFNTWRELELWLAKGKTIDDVNLKKN